MSEKKDGWDIAEEKFAFEIYIEEDPLDDYYYEVDDGIITRERK